MPRYLLDTDTVSYALQDRGKVAARLFSHKPSEVFVSSITLAELRYGAEKRRSRALHNRIDDFVGTVTVLPFDKAAADRFGAVAIALADRGTPIGNMDTLIAAHALAAQLVLVTNNTKHFARVDGLKTENWV